MNWKGASVVAEIKLSCINFDRMVSIDIYIEGNPLELVSKRSHYIMRVDMARTGKQLLMASP